MHLKEFQNLKASDPKFDLDLRKLWTTLGPHIKEEESEDLPKLESKLSREESVATAKEFQMTKKFVPTRSHPSAPDQPVSLAPVKWRRITDAPRRCENKEKAGRHR